MKTETTEELPVLSGPREWRIEVRHAGRERVRVLRQGEELTIGTSEEATLTVVDTMVSSLHCRLAATPRGLFITDLGSTNGIFVGEGRVDRALLVGSRVAFTIGRTSVIALDRGDTETPADLGLIGDSEPMRRLRDRIRSFARLEAPVLLLGESGTGKDLVARALHVESGRAGEYVPLNVAAVPETLFDAELFGHVRGAFTGADAPRAGAFRAANGGTLFLDEIAELSQAGQAKLLRVVEDGMVRPVGSATAERVKTRVVTATCAPLLAWIEADRFRHDLFHRLSILTISLPPLRSRTSDIPDLVRAFFARLEGELGPKRLLPSTLELLRAAPWPGNVRQLFAVLYKAAALTPGEVIGPGQFELEPPRRKEPSLGIERALSLLDAHGSVSAAARAAGVPRTTFRSVIERKGSRPRPA